MSEANPQGEGQEALHNLSGFANLQAIQTRVAFFKFY